MSRDIDIVAEFLGVVKGKLPEISESAAADIDRELRKHFGGESFYVKKRDPRLHEKIAAGFNGHNVNDLVIKSGASRRTVYRAIRDARLHTSAQKS